MTARQPPTPKALPGVTGSSSLTGVSKHAVAVLRDLWCHISFGMTYDVMSECPSTFYIYLQYGACVFAVVCCRGSDVLLLCDEKKTYVMLHGSSCAACVGMGGCCAVQPTSLPRVLGRLLWVSEWQNSAPARLQVLLAHQ